MRRAILLSIFCAIAASPILADTIYLKNGGRIVAASVTESGDRVVYETVAGELSIPKSSVERIERNGLSDSLVTTVVVGPPVSAPKVESDHSYEDVERMTIHNDAVDFGYIAHLETEARTGLAEPTAKAAAAHYAAAEFMLGKGDTNGAMDHLHDALALAPDNVPALLNLAILYLHNSEYTQALGPLEHAQRVTPESSPEAADVEKLLGWAYSGANKLDRAVEAWKLSEKLRADPEVERALVKAERDKAEEENYREGETLHFALKYYGGANPDLAADILRRLEEDFDDLESQLNYTPPEQIAVILYTQQAFADITQAPGWVGALNDGRLRIPVQGLTSVTPELAHVLKHELTHSFVGQKTHGRAPTWLQEGIAQWMEGKRSGALATGILAAASNNALPSLQSLEGPWMALPTNTVTLAYPWSLAVIEDVIQSGDVSDVDRLMDRIGASSSDEGAVREVLHTDYNGLEQQSLEYLHHQYIR